jgi:hypothetical protein
VTGTVGMDEDSDGGDVGGDGTAGISGVIEPS